VLRKREHAVSGRAFLPENQLIYEKNTDVYSD
jgi:hypothetical protein